MIYKFLYIKVYKWYFGAKEMVEINLMNRYPKGKRQVDMSMDITDEQRRIAREYGEDYFDGDRMYGYGGHHYHQRFWTDVTEDFRDHYNLTSDSKVLDIGCAKGFMLYDLTRAVPGIKVNGIDVSKYALNHSDVPEEVRPYLSIGNAKNLTMFGDKELDLVVSINTLHNLPRDECAKALGEIQRIGKSAFIMVEGWRNEQEKAKLEKWAKTAYTMMHVDDWKEFFKESGYRGDYYWFFP